MQARSPRKKRGFFAGDNPKKIRKLISNTHTITVNCKSFLWLLISINPLSHDFNIDNIVFLAFKVFELTSSQLGKVEISQA